MAYDCTAHTPAFAEHADLELLDVNENIHWNQYHQTKARVRD